MKLNSNYGNDDANEVKRFIFILLGIIVVIGGIYAITAFVKKKEEAKLEKTSEEGSINYDVVSVGTMFDKKESEYYVFLYDTDDNNSILYNYIFSTYKSQKDSLAIYYANIAEKLNEKYYSKDNKSNPKAKDINDVMFGNLTLVKIKNGKITKYFEKIEDIKKELGIN